MGFSFLKTALAAAVLLGGTTAGVALADDVTVGLITKTETNPFFVKMREGAEAKAKELNVKLIAAAGKYDGDNDGQVAAIENLISAGAKGFAIVPSDSKAIVPTIQKARDAGLKVIVLDTPLDPMNAADATFATDNRKAGMLIGQWASKTMGDKSKDASIVFLDLATNQPTVDYLRDQGFMQGFGIDVKDPNKYGCDDRIGDRGCDLFDPFVDRGAEVLAPIVGRLPEDRRIVAGSNQLALQNVDRGNIHQLRSTCAGARDMRRHRADCRGILRAPREQMAIEDQAATDK